MATNHRLILSSAVTALALNAGCAATRVAQWEQAPSLAETAEPSAADAAAALVTEADGLWEQRADQAKLEEALGKWKQAAETAPSAELFVKLSRGHYLLADGFHALNNNVELRNQHYTEGLDWAERAIQAAAPEFVAAVQSGEKHRDAIKKAPKDAVPGLYWYSTNMGKWASSKSFATVLKHKDDIKATMDQVMALDPDYFFAAPYRYFGAYEARTAGLAGGSLVKSEEYFTKAVALAPNYLATKVLWAEYLCPKQKETGKETARRLLEEVIAANPDAEPSISVENAIEQQKAKALLARLDELF